jgi:ABC-2 type transport system permease protein
MGKILTIIKREYLTRVKTRAFIISTIITPLLLLAMVLGPIFFVVRGGGERRVTVIDQSGEPGVFEAIERSVDARSDSTDEANRRDPGPGRTRYVLTLRTVRPDEKLEEAMRPYNEQASRDADSTYLVLKPGLIDGTEPEYYARNTSDFSIQTLQRAVSEAVVGLKLKRAGLDQTRINEYTRPVSLKTNKITSGGEIQEGGRMDFLVAFVMLFFLYITLLFYGLFVLRGVIEEKQSRIIEVLVSSAKPTQIMLGKVIGIGLVGLTQITLWALSAWLLTTFGVRALATGAPPVPAIPPSLLVYFVVFFVLGYFLYATLYALVGATVTSEDDAQQAQMPVTMLLVVPMIVANMVIANPMGGPAMVLSMIPFFAPIIMMMRIAAVNPPLWQVLLSMGIMVLTILGVIWLAARIYRVGILMYGKRPSIAELGKWLRYS